MSEKVPSQHSAEHYSSGGDDELSGWEKLHAAKDVLGVMGDNELSGWEKINKVGSIGLNLAALAAETGTRTQGTHKADSAPTAPETSPAVPEVSPTAQIGALLGALSDRIGNAPETPAETAPEAGARATLETVPEIQEETDKTTTLRVKVLNGLDRAQSRARLLTQREKRASRHVAKLEDKLANLKPGPSRRRRHLQRRLAIKSYKRNNLASSHERAFGRIHDRSLGNTEEIEKNAKIEKKRNMLRVKHQVALEKKRRKKIEKKYEKELQADGTDLGIKDKLRKNTLSSMHRRERLKTIKDGWNENSLADFEQKLTEEVKKKFESKVGGDS